MKAIELEPAVSVSPQIALPEVAEAAARGFKSIVNNRPDGEEPQQPSSDAIAAAAQAAGLAYRYIPISPGQFTDQAQEDFAAALAELPAPVLAYCRSGTRSATMWGISKASAMGTENVLEAAARAGYDLSYARGLMDGSR